VATTALAHFPGNPENIAYLSISFQERVVGHIHVNWLAPVKVRRTLIAGSRRMIVYDELEPSEKVKLYDRGVSLEGRTEDIHNLLVGYRMGDMLAPRLDHTEALQTEVRHF